MKTQWLIPVILSAAVCLTGCGRRNDLTIQEDMIPVVPVETAAAVQTHLTEGTTGTASAKTETCSAVTALLTGTGKTEAASVTGKTAADAAGTKTFVTKAEETAAQQKTGGSGGAVSPEQLSGKWETVSFSREGVI